MTRHIDPVSKGGWTYILANKPRGMTYVGVTAHLPARIDQHRRDVGSTYCRKYGIKTLVLAEWHETIQDAIVREKRLKAWQKAWKFRLIEESNPDWRDLYDTLA